MIMKHLFADRKDLDIISEFIGEGASVLDLGCGDGTLLKKLKDEKNIIARGVEISEENIIACITKGISVFQSNLDEGLKDYAEKSFDYVILSQTLQAVHKPRMVLNEALKVGKRVIVSIPNFGYWQIRWKLLLNGRMPKVEFLPYDWYDTPNIRVLTISDFKDLCAKDGIKIEKEVSVMLGNKKDNPLTKLWPNIFAQASIFLVTKER